MTTTMDPDVYEGEAQPLVEHLREFRQRFIIALLTVLVTTLLVMPFAESALQLLIYPLQTKPQALNPTDALVQWFRVALVGGITIAVPMVLYQIVAFLLPALTRRESRYLFLFLPAATLFFVGGVVFGALVALPVSLNFLQNFGTSFAEIQWTLEAYVSFVTTLLLALGIGFQTPLVIFFIAKLGIVSHSTLIKNTRWAFLASAILAAVLTPTPDPWTMVVVMIPLFLLYLLGVLFARFA